MHMHPDALFATYKAVRDRTVALTEPLSAEDCCVQSMTDASPAKWHLAHTTWFFETFILEAHEADFRPYHPAFRMLFNSYYNAIGDKYPRPQRGMLTRPSLGDVLAYRNSVDERMASLLAYAKGCRTGAAGGNRSAARAAAPGTDTDRRQAHVVDESARPCVYAVSLAVCSKLSAVGMDCVRCRHDRNRSCRETASATTMKRRAIVSSSKRSRWRRDW